MNNKLHSTHTRQCYQHGVFVDIFDCGVLITGSSGIGKSELGLSLINRGHALIADDSVLLTQRQHKLIASCPPILQDFLEVRGLGLLNIRAMFGDPAIRREKDLQLIINLLHSSNVKLTPIERLEGMFEKRQLLGKEIAEVTIPVITGRSLTIIVEAAVRHQKLKMAGYHASDDFQQRQLRSTQHDC